MAHRSDHLTLNPSPEGEGLYSIAEAMVALKVTSSKTREWQAGTARRQEEWVGLHVKTEMSDESGKTILLGKYPNKGLMLWIK